MNRHMLSGTVFRTCSRIFLRRVTALENRCTQVETIRGITRPLHRCSTIGGNENYVIRDDKPASRPDCFIDYAINSRYFHHNRYIMAKMAFDL